MKKNLSIICLITSTLFISSCMREDLPQKDEPIIERTTINVELKKNQSYTYSVPQNLSDDPYQITEQAKHASKSELSTTLIYTYTPALNYVGTDQVIIANVEEQHNGNQHGCGNGGGNNSNHNHGCSGGKNQDQETERIITINFIIKETAVGKPYRFIGTPSF